MDDIDIGYIDGSITQHCSLSLLGGYTSGAYNSQSYQEEKMIGREEIKNNTFGSITHNITVISYMVAS